MSDVEKTIEYLDWLEYEINQNQSLWDRASEEKNKEDVALYSALWQATKNAKSMFKYIWLGKDSMVE